jgi:hypothetical protein
LWRSAGEEAVGRGGARSASMADAAAMP